MEQPGQRFHRFIGSSSAQTRMNYISQFISTFFNQTNNDINTIASYIQLDIADKLNVSVNYDTYYGVSSVDARVSPVDAYGHSFFSTTYMNGISSDSQLNNLTVAGGSGSSIYDNVFRAIYSASNIYVGIYFGFDSNGFYRYYPYTSFNAYPTFAYTCAYNNLATVGYDPRCRGWYNIAKSDDSVHYTSPYVDALSGKVLITSSKRIMSGNQLFGVIGMDYSMQQINDIIVQNIPYGTGYTFLMDSTGSIIAYPNLTLSSIPQTITQIESQISASVWTSVLNQSQNTTSIVMKNSQNWTLIYQYIPQQTYFLVMLYPSSDVATATNLMFAPIGTAILTGIIVLSVLLGLILMIDVFVLLFISKKYTKPIILLAKDIEDIGKSRRSYRTSGTSPGFSRIHYRQQEFR